MNICRQAVSLFARSRHAARSTAVPRMGLLNSNPAERHQRTFSDEKKPNDDIYPKLPVESPISFAQKVVQKEFKMAQWCTEELGMAMDEVMDLNQAAQQVMVIATKSIVEEDYGTLEEKFTPEALESAKSYISLLPRDERELLLFEGVTKGIFLPKYTFFHPWKFTSTDSSLTLTFIAFQFHGQTFRQTMWGLTMDIPRDGSTLSDNWQVKEFHFETFLPSPPE